MTDDRVRASGKTTNEEVTAEQAQELTEQPTVELPDERQRRFQTTGFSRMKTDWNSEQNQFVRIMHRTIDDQLKKAFADAFALQEELFLLVRTPAMRNGEPIINQDGSVEWKRKQGTGDFVEDWAKLNAPQRERFLYQITTRMFVWEQRAAEAWAESMYAKVLWEQQFSSGYDDLPSGSKDTIEGRTARAKMVAAEDQFLAIFRTYYSRKADAIVRSMERLNQRIKDIHVAN